MEFELHPSLTILPGAFHLLVAPPEMLIDALNAHLELQRFKVLYVPGNHSRILNGLNRRFTDLDVRRAFTAFQLMTVLQEAHHTIIIVEHDPLLYQETDEELEEPVSWALKQAAENAVVLLYSPGYDPSLDRISKLADRVFSFNTYQPRSRLPAKHRQSTEVNQTTLGAF